MQTEEQNSEKSWHWDDKNYAADTITVKVKDILLANK